MKVKGKGESIWLKTKRSGGQRKWLLCGNVYAIYIYM